MERWTMMAKKADFQKISERFHIDPVTARIIRNRDVQGEEAVRQYLSGSLEDIADPRLLKDMDRALMLIRQKINEGRKIRIIGDYDIDGVISTYILMDGLTRLGAVADTYIPDRISDGYGIHENLVRQAASDGIDTMITCDNGISAREEIALAKELGMTVIITDHHNVPYEDREGSRYEILPPADAIVNPKQKDCAYPFKEICGAVVAYKFIEALYRLYLREPGEYEKYLELTAIATVGDVMELQGENRILVKEGLRRLKNPQNPGIRALIHASELDSTQLSAYHIGFVLGPCINASGRLDTAHRSLELLQAEDEQEVARLAGDLRAMNDSRKALTQEGVDEAVALVEESSLMEDRVLVVYLPRCHESLAGIIAGRLRERYYRPALVLTKGENAVKGSGRSIEEYSMYDELNQCRDLLLQFGGHPMAAGLSLEEKNISLLRKRLNEQCTLTPQQLMPKVVIDVPMPLSYVTQDLVRELSVLEPFGKGNPRPLFAQRQIRVLEPRVFGKNRNVVRMKLFDGTGTVTGIYFGEGDVFYDYVSRKDLIDIAYYPEINSWQGRSTLQIVIKNYR